MIITDREGCSGSWLTELLLLGGRTGQAFFRQDRAGGNVSTDHLHGNGHDDQSLRDLRDRWTGEKIIRCHSTNFALLRELWPDEMIVRIVPKTSILQAVAAAYYKTRTDTDPTVAAAFDFINHYYQLFKNDPKPVTVDNSCVIDFGVLSRERPFERLCEELFELPLQDNHWRFWRDYWMLQHYPVDEERLVVNITPLNLYRVFDREPTAFNLACFVFVYELMNDLPEESRLWSIDQAATNFSELLNQMQYR